MIQTWQLSDDTTKVHSPKEARSSGIRSGQRPYMILVEATFANLHTLRAVANFIVETDRCTTFAGAAWQTLFARTACCDYSV